MIILGSYGWNLQGKNLWSCALIFWKLGVVVKDAKFFLKNVLSVSKFTKAPFVLENNVLDSDYFAQSGMTIWLNFSLSRLTWTFLKFGMDGGYMS